MSGLTQNEEIFGAVEVQPGFYAVRAIGGAKTRWICWVQQRSEFHSVRPKLPFLGRIFPTEYGEDREPGETASTIDTGLLPTKHTRGLMLGLVSIFDKHKLAQPLASKFGSNNDPGVLRQLIFGTDAQRHCSVTILQSRMPIIDRVGFRDLHF